ncbi:MAG: T9SS type A sorting domain-containing protein [Bacteroidetes bacterium]|nr:T9SS type A sorting domain-containing protein [Bacteroidota bacterium]
MVYSNGDASGIRTQSSKQKTENTLFQNQPNPFNQTTIIHYSLASDVSNAQLAIRSLNGELVKSIAVSNTGKGKITINANELTSGTYTYTLMVNNESVDTKLMVVTK